MDIHLIRHPRTVAPHGTCYGSLDIEADPDRLAADAARLADAVPPDARFVSSPQRRARVLAETLAGREVPVDERLVEMDFGAWEGRLWDDLPRGEIDAWSADVAGYAPPGGESIDAMAARVLDWWREVPDGEAPLVVVSHGGPLRLIASHVVGAPPAGSMAFEIQWGRRALVWRNPARTVLAGWNLP